MTKCYKAPYVMPAASMGKLNPLPDIKNISYIHAKIDTTENIPERHRKYINKGMIPTMLPYCQQDGYDRNRKERAFNSIVIENEYIKAVFLPELGGRLWSLIDKTENKELLYCNPVFQPGNLALRNAWFSGGVEFNVSIKGHNPLTCDNLFAEKITMEDGSEGVRMYEYERIRGVLYCIDAWIPEGSKYLYIRPRIENRTGKEIWMYWWSNIAVPVFEKARVLAPANNTFINYFGNDAYVLDYGTMPYQFDADITYPENMGRSIDFFFDVEDDEEKWITQVDKDGYGLIQCSTKEMKGRKLFLWGEGAGGKNWNQYLSDGTNSGYVEIQAGLARTQLEHIPMADGETWSWVEAYGATNCGAEAHADFETAKKAVEKNLLKDFPETMTKGLEKARNAKIVKGETFNLGSGWGIVDEYRRKAEGLPTLSSDITLSEEALGDAEKEWLGLLEKGYLADRDVNEEPLGYVVEDFWRNTLAKSVEDKANRNWYALMQLGVMEYAAGNSEKAMELFKESVEVKANAWSLRNIAMIYRNELKDYEKAYEYMVKAFALNKTCRGIVVDTAVTFLLAGKNKEWLEAYESLGDLKEDGRIKLSYAKAYMNLGEFKEAAKYLNYDIVMPDIKEGDTAISDEWFKLYGEILKEEYPQLSGDELQKVVEEKYPLGELDFRTH